MKDVTLSQLPDCNICAQDRLERGLEGARARFDGPTKLGPHAYMCHSCFQKYGYPQSSITSHLVVEPATHHGPWCDDPDVGPGEMCPKCRGFEPQVDIGLWLFARLAVHWEYNRRLPVNRQAPLAGFELSGADWMEIAQLSLELGKIKMKGGR